MASAPILETMSFETVTAVAAAVNPVAVRATTWIEEKEDEKGKVTKFLFSKQEGVVLESENKFFLGRKGNPKLLEEEVGWLFFGGTISFGGGRTKFGGLNFMMARTFSWGTNSCFLIRFDLARSSCWNSTSWVERLILGLKVGNKPKIIFFGALIHTIWPSGHNACGEHLFALKLKFSLI